jgi:hypothetical protein
MSKPSRVPAWSILWLPLAFLVAAPFAIVYAVANFLWALAFFFAQMFARLLGLKTKSSARHP